MEELRALAHNSIIKNNKKSLNQRKRKNSTESISQTKMLKNNYYSVLDVENFECESEVFNKFTQHVDTNSSSINNNNSQTERGSSIQPKTTTAINAPSTSANSNNNQNNENKNKKIDNDNKEKIPPINIFNINPNELIEFIKTGLKITDFQLKDFYNKNKKIILYLNSVPNYIRVTTYLEKSKVKFFTFTPKCIKKKTILLKGLSSDTDPVLIYDELCKYESDDLQIFKVTRYQTTKSRNEGTDLPIFLVQLSSDSNINKLKSIRGLIHRCIRWEPLRKQEITQCRNCQGFFHSASNCHLTRRCVKCGESHERGECSLSTVSTEEREKLFCVICNKHGHPASYKGCEKYKELQNKIRSKRHALKTNRPDVFTTVNPNISYANITSRGVNTSNLIQQNNIENNNFNDLKSTIHALSNQIIALQKQLELQSKQISTIFSLIDV